jgi:HK97 family phage portal protein
VLFDNLCAPRGALVTPNKIDPDLAKRLQTEWERSYSGQGLAKVAVLANGLDFKDINFKAVDAELLDTIKASTADIARAFGIPRQFLEDVDHATFASAVEGTRALYALTLRAFTSRIADAFSQRLLSRGDRANGSSVEFDLTALLILPGQEQAEFCSKLVNGGVATPNEVRNVYLGLPDLPGGNVLRVPSNTAPLNKWIEGQQAPSVPTPAADGEQP